MSREETAPSLLVIFGGTGDLARRKLLPVLARLFASGRIGPSCHVLGVARSAKHDDASYRDLAISAAVDAGVARSVCEPWARGSVHFQPLGDGDDPAFAALRQRIEAIEAAHGLPGNRVFYLALPTDAMEGAVTGLGASGLNRSRGYTRLVLEKPFGHDLVSAERLIADLHRHFDERQIFRIDHYLGKETVQNLLVFRFANALFESVWNREHIEAIQIVAAEEIGVCERAGYYDRSGALRDMIQNHLTQLLSLLTMEPPNTLDAESIRYEKTKVLRAIDPIDARSIVFGQYTGGQIRGQAVPGYLEEPGVAPNSSTETFAALEVEIRNWRWHGVPIYLWSGKRMARRTTVIAVRFRNTPVCLFEKDGSCMVSSDVLLLTLQPDEGFSLHIDVKVPGVASELRAIPLAFRYGDLFDPMPEAYELLIHDVLAGDQTLFVHADEVLAAWRLYDPILSRRPVVHPYAAGSWGPREAQRIALPDRPLWEKPAPPGRAGRG